MTGAGRARWLRATAACIALLAAGCELAGYGAHVVAGGKGNVRVKAAYKGLAGQSTAVLVGVPDRALARDPNTDRAIVKAIAQRIRKKVPKVEIEPPRRTVRFQRQNPYWIVQPYDRLIERLGVERLVIVDLLEYRLHEKGNRHVWQGRAVARVVVVEAKKAPKASFERTVRVRYPANTRVGVVDAEPQRIRAGLLRGLARKIGRLFYEHRVPEGKLKQ